MPVVQCKFCPRTFGSATSTRKHEHSKHPELSTLSQEMLLMPPPPPPPEPHTEALVAGVRPPSSTSTLDVSSIPLPPRRKDDIIQHQLEVCAEARPLTPTYELAETDPDNYLPADIRAFLSGEVEDTPRCLPGETPDVVTNVNRLENKFNRIHHKHFVEERPGGFLQWCSEWNIPVSFTVPLPLCRDCTDIGAKPEI